MTYKITKTYGENIEINELEMAVPVEERLALAAKRPITLNGKPATVSGIYHKFAVIRQLNGTARAEWNWETAKRIINNGGKFQS